MVSENTSIRRRVTEFEANVEKFSEESPTSLREYADLMEKVGTIGIEGYTRVTVSIVGRTVELEDLADELTRWTPGGGWSPEAQRLFKALRGEDTYS